MSSGPANSVDFARPLREPGQALPIEHDHHLFGVFPDATGRRLIDDSRLERLHRGRRRRRVVGVPPAEKFRRQIEAGYLGLAGTNRLTKSSAVCATSCQPWSMVNEWPRLGIFLISVTLGLRCCRL